MAPILINQSDFGKIGFLILFVLVLTFAGGFIAGQQTSSLIDKSQGNDPRSLSEESGSLQADDNDLVDEDVAVKHMPVDLTETKEVTADTEHMAEPNAESALDLADGSLSTHSAMLKNKGKIKFSIQVAVYGSLKNAEKMMKKLQKKNLDAYVSDYVSKQNHVRFNVRFGYFNDKESAMNALQDYSNNQQGDGYLVNFSADNIVKFAQDISGDDAPARHGNAVLWLP